jgi:FkbM family methyltransferase
MRIEKLDDLNRVAEDAAAAFRASLAPDAPRAIDAAFHQKKNQFPYFGFVDVAVEGSRFVMFVGNDDLVALTYFWYGASAYERTSLRVWHERARTARCILDIGAFTGVYSLAAAAVNPEAQIFAFEPVRRTYGRLLLNVQANRFTKAIRPVNMGASSGEGTAMIRQFRQENILGNGASILDKGIPTVSADEQINLTAIDAFVAANGIAPDLIKMDVEGAELLALEGMKATLAARRATMLIEVTPATFREVAAVMRRAGYRMQVVDDAGGGLRECPETVTAVCNLLVAPLR